MKFKSIMLIILMIVILLSSNVYAIGDIFRDAEGFIDTGKRNTRGTIDTNSLNNSSSAIFNIFLGVGIGVAIIVGAILGLQFMTAGIDKKVQVKEALVAYVISCIVLFGAFGIWKLVVVILSSIE